MEPIIYRKQLEGKSNAHLITFNDGKDYVVKFFQQGFERTLPNEWISYCLGRYLGLPIPYAKIVQILPEFSSSIPELTEASQNPYQFLSLYIPDCLNAHEVSTIESITNHKMLASIIVLDYWLYNGDRTRKNILFQQDGPEHHYRLWAIDHAEIFGTYDWKLNELKKLPHTLIQSATHKLLAQYIQDEKDFFEAVELISLIPAYLIEEIVNVIPDEWMLTGEEKKAIVNTLIKRRKNTLPKVIKRFIQQIYRPLHKNKK